MEDSAIGVTNGLGWSGSWGNCIITEDRQEVSADFADPFVYIDLEAVYEITKVSLAPPGQKNTIGLIGGMKIVVSENPLDSVDSFNDATLCATLPDYGFSEKSPKDSREDGYMVVDFVCTAPIQGRYIGFINEGTNKMIAFCEAQVYCHNGPNPSPSPTFSPSSAPTSPPTAAPTARPTDELVLQQCPSDGNLALGKPVGYNQAVGLHFIMEDSAIGVTNGLGWSGSWGNCIITEDRQEVSADFADPFVYIDLEAVYEITKVSLAPPGQKNTIGLIGGMKIVVSENPLDSVDSFDDATLCATVPEYGFSEKQQKDDCSGDWPVSDYTVVDFVCATPIQGRYVGFINEGTNKMIAFCEAEVYCSTEAAEASSHWIAAGGMGNKVWNGIPNAECADNSRLTATEPTYNGADIAVSCCSADGSSGVRKFGENKQCYQAVTYDEAEAICQDNGLRLCSLSEMLSGKVTASAGCNHDMRYNWVSDECSSDSGHYVHQGRTSLSMWASKSQKDYYCQSDSSNQAAYWSWWGRANIGVGCCYEDEATGTVKGARPDCNAHPSTFAEAEAVCAAHCMRLCSLAEMKTGITAGKGCNYDNVYQWVSDSCDPSTNAAASHSASHSVHAQDAGESFDDFAAITLGAAVGVAMVAVVVAVIVVMRRRKGMDNGKEQEVAMSEVVTAPKVEPAQSMDGVDTI